MLLCQVGTQCNIKNLCGWKGFHQELIIIGYWLEGKVLALRCECEHIPKHLTAVTADIDTATIGWYHTAHDIEHEPVIVSTASQVKILVQLTRDMFKGRTGNCTNCEPAEIMQQV